MQYINTWSRAFDFRIISLILILAVPAGTHAALAESDQLPDLATFGLEGDLPDLEGKVVLLDFWASWCAPCKKSFPAMDELYKELKDQGFVILAVSVDSTAKAYEKFVSKSEVTFPLMLDAQKKLVEAAEIEVMPTSLMIDKSGVIRSIHKGFMGQKTIDTYRDEAVTLLAE